MYRILIGEISSNKAIVIAKFLQLTYSDILIVSYDNKKFSSKIHSRYSDEHYVVKYINRVQYVGELAKLCSEKKIDLFIPVHSNYIGEILNQKDKFGSCLNYIGSFETYSHLHDKKRMQETVELLGIPMPVKYPDFEQAIVPFVGKPTNQSSSKGVFYIQSEEEKQRFTKKTDEAFIYQSYVEGIGCGYSVFAIDGKIMAGYGHIRLMEYPVSGGSSVYRAPFEHINMKNYAEKILSVVKWSGFAMFEFKLTKENELYLIEVNPRIWGSINQGLVNGVNYFEKLIPLNPKTKEDQKFNTYMNPQIMLSVIGYLLKGRINSIGQFLRNISVNKADISLFGDFKGYMSTVLRLIFK